MKQEDIIKYALIAAAAYIAYRYFFANEEGEEQKVVEDSSEGTQPGAGAGTQPGAGTNPGAGAGSGVTPPPTSPNPPAPVFVTRPEIAVVSQGLIQRLKQAANGQNSFPVDEWNWFLRTLNPNAVATDLSEVRPASDRLLPMTAEQYIAFRAQAGLDPVETVTGASRSDYNTGSSRGGSGGGVRGYFVN